MSDNLAVKVTADVVDLQTKMAVARAEVQATTRELNSLARQAASSGETDALKASLTQAAEKAIVAKNNFRALTEETGNMVSMTTRARTEMIVLAHEMVQGRFARIPGSMMVLAESLGGVSLATWGMIGAAAAAIGTVAYLGYESYESAKEVDKLRDSFMLTGRGAEMSAAAVKQQLDFLSELPGSSHKAAQGFMELVAQDGKLSNTLANQVGQLLPAFVKSYGDDAPKAAGKLLEALSDLTVSGFQNLDRSMLNLAPDQYEHIVKLIRTGQEAQATSEILRQLSANTGIYIKSLGDRVYDAEQKVIEAQERLKTASGLLAFGAPGGADRLEEYRDQLRQTQDALRDLQNQQKQQVQKAADADYKEGIRGADAIVESLDRRAKVTREITALETTLAAARTRNDAAGIATAERAIQLEQEQLAHMDAKGGSKAWQEYVSAERAKIAATQEGTLERLEIEREWAARAGQVYGQSSRQYQEALSQINGTLRAMSQERRQIALNDLQTELQLMKSSYVEKKAMLDEEVAAGRLSKEQEMAELIEMLQEQEVLQLEAVTQAEAGYKLDTLKFHEAENQKKVIAAQTAAEIAQLRRQGTQAEIRDQFNLNEEILSSERMLVADIFQGRKNLLQIVGGIGLRMAQDWATMELQQLTRHIFMESSKTAATQAGAAARTALGLSENSSFFARVGLQIAEWLGLESAKTTETVAGAATRAAAEGAATAASIAGTKAQALAEIPALTGTAAMGAASAVAPIPVVGPMLALAAFGEMEALGATALSIAAFDVGTNYVPHDMLAMVHEGERIIPKADNAGLMDALGSGGGRGDAHLHVHAADAASVERLFKNNGRALAKVLRDVLADNPSLRPAK